MKRTSALIVPLIALLAAAPYTGCGGDPAETPGSAGGDAGDKDPDGKSSDGSTGGGNDDSKPGDGSTSEPEDSTGSTEGENPGGKIDCSKLQVSGVEAGQVPGNVTLVNAKGEKVNLHDYCNDILYVMAGSAF